MSGTLARGLQARVGILEGLQRMTNLAMVPVEEKAKLANPVIERPVDTSATSIERRSPARQASRGDKRRVRPAIIMHIVQVSDLMLLLLSGLLTKVMLTSPHWLRSDGSQVLATFVGSVVTSIFLSGQCVPVALILSACQTTPDSSFAAAFWWGQHHRLPIPDA